MAAQMKRISKYYLVFQITLLLLNELKHAVSGTKII